MNIDEFLKENKFESKNVEFKEIVSHKNYEKWAKTIVAFANTNGGVLAFGINDDEKIIGIDKQLIKQDILYINDISSKYIHPRVSFDYEKVETKNNKFILFVKVEKSKKTPVWLLRSDGEDVIYIRRDSESVIAQGEEIEELILKSRKVPFDSEISNIDFKDVTFNKLNEIYKANNNLKIDLSLKILESKNIVISEKLTNTGLIFADGNYIKNCNIACRIWPGLTKGSSVMIDRKTYSGDLLSALEFAKNYIHLYTKKGVIKLDNGTRTDIVSYPERAVNEALINAFAHRDYYIDGSQIDIDIFLDRIQISSPGKFLFPGSAQEYSLRNIPSKRRNENICKILEMCKLMESSGSGFEKIADAYDPFGKKFEPKIYSDPAHFVISLMDLTYKEEKKKKIMPTNFEFSPPKTGNREYDYKILSFCMSEPKSRSEIQEYLDLSDRKSFKSLILNPLIDKDLLLMTQESPKAPNQKYYTNKEKIKFNV